MNTDFLIIGSGIAGLSLAIKLSENFPNKTITVVTKSSGEESNTRYAQGGIAVVQNKEDSFEKHIQDTLIAGDGLCDENVVRMVIENGPKRLEELIEWGSEFDKNGNKFDLGKEGGHSEYRVVHSKDQTGNEIEQTLLTKVRTCPNIRILEFHFAIDLQVKNNECFGAIILNEKNNQQIFYSSAYTILATGGIGTVYGHTTNPSIATGDGIAMAYRAGAKICDMEFIQFHPTALYQKNNEIKRTFLISEAVRGFGAILRTKQGEAFMHKYDHRGDLASRDIVSQSIHKELRASGDDCVYMDCTHLNISKFKKHFPMIYQKCLDSNIDISKDWIPIIPSQHYICGGIVVDKNGRTSIPRLLACGECTRTGLHGANRLASNSLLEALVYADAIFKYCTDIENIEEFERIERVERFEKFERVEKIEEKIQLVQKTMHQYVGIVRTDDELLFAKNELEQIQSELKNISTEYCLTKEAYELNNMLDVGLLIIEQSLQRTENKGGFVKI